MFPPCFSCVKLAFDHFMNNGLTLQPYVSTKIINKLQFQIRITLVRKNMLGILIKSQQRASCVLLDG